MTMHLGHWFSRGRLHARNSDYIIDNYISLYNIIITLLNILYIVIEFFLSLHGDKTYNSFVCGNTT